MARIIYNKGKFMTEDGDGGRREATRADILNSDLRLPEELKGRIMESLRAQFGDDIKGIIPELPLQQQGVTVGERLKLKNFASNPQVARKYLEGLGYQVRDYGKQGWLGGWNFAVRKSSQDPWRTVDPAGFGVFGSDLVMDLADLTVDAIQGWLTTQAAIAGGVLGGATGGPVGAVSGAAGFAGAMGYGTQSFRQGIGQELGLPQTTDQREAAIVGAASALGPVIEKGAGAVSRVAQRAGGKVFEVGKEAFKEIGGVLTGAKEAGPLGKKDVFTGRVRDVAKVMQKLPSWDKTVRDVRKAVGLVADQDIQESVEASQIINSLRGAPVDIRAALDDLRELALQKTPRATGEAISAPALKSEAGQLLDSIYAYLGSSGVDVTDTSKVPIEIAEALKTSVQHFVSGKGGFGARDITPRSQEIVSAASQLSGRLRTLVEQTADASGIQGTNGLNYSQNMALLANKTRQLGAMKSAIGLDVKGMKGDERARRWLEGLWGKNASTRLAFAENFRQQFGLDVKSPAMRALIGENIGEQGVPPLLPKIPLSAASIPSMMGGMLGGFAGGGQGAFMGTGLGTLAMGTGAIALAPRNLVRLGKLGMAAEARTRAAAQMAAPIAMEARLPAEVTLQMALQKRARRRAQEEEQP